MLSETGLSEMLYPIVVCTHSMIPFLRGSPITVVPKSASLVSSSVPSECASRGRSSSTPPPPFSPLEEHEHRVLTRFGADLMRRRRYAAAEDAVEEYSPFKATNTLDRSPPRLLYDDTNHAQLALKGDESASAPLNTYASVLANESRVGRSKGTHVSCTGSPMRICRLEEQNHWKRSLDFLTKPKKSLQTFLLPVMKPGLVLL